MRPFTCETIPAFFHLLPVGTRCDMELAGGGDGSALTEALASPWKSVLCDDLDLMASPAKISFWEAIFMAGRFWWDILTFEVFMFKIGVTKFWGNFGQNFRVWNFRIWNFASIVNTINNKFAYILYTMYFIIKRELWQKMVHLYYYFTHTVTQASIPRHTSGQISKYWQRPDFCTIFLEHHYSLYRSNLSSSKYSFDMKDCAPRLLLYTHLSHNNTQAALAGAIAHNFSCTLSIQKGKPPIVSWDRFFRLLWGRIFTARRGGTILRVAAAW